LKQKLFLWQYTVMCSNSDFVLKEGRKKGMQAGIRVTKSEFEVLRFAFDKYHTSYQEVVGSVTCLHYTSRL
jgi:hypothetical protein